jgi:hypothetical protein
MGMTEISDRRLPAWRPRPHPLTADEAARFLQRLRRDLVDSFGHDPRHFRLAPARPGEGFNGIAEPRYVAGFIRGLASGESIDPGLHFRVQETFPQLTRLFITTHEAFHHVDFQMNTTAGALARQFPRLVPAIEALQLSALTRGPGPEARLAFEAFTQSLSPSERHFMINHMERLADAAAAVYLLDQIRHPQVREFLEAWQALRREGVSAGDNVHLTADTVAAAIEAYGRAAAAGQINPGAMTMRDAATFVQPHVARHLDRPQSAAPVERNGEPQAAGPASP